MSALNKAISTTSDIAGLADSTAPAFIWTNQQAFQAFQTAAVSGTLAHLYNCVDFVETDEPFDFENFTEQATAIH